MDVRRMLVVDVVLLISLYCLNIALTISACTILYIRGSKTRFKSRILFLLVVMTTWTTVDLAAMIRLTVELVFKNPTHFTTDVLLSKEIFVVAPVPILLSMLAHSTNCILGDMFVAWRAWVVCERRHGIWFTFTLLIIFTLVPGVYGVYAVVKCGEATPSESCPDYGYSMLLLSCLTLATNVSSTAFILRHTLTRLRLVKELQHAVEDRQVTRALLILLESGFLYTFLCITTAVFWATSHHAAHFILRSIVSQLTAMYPTAIIVLVHLCSKIPGSRHEFSITELSFAHPEHDEDKDAMEDTVSEHEGSLGAPVSRELEPQCEFTGTPCTHNVGVIEATSV